MGAPSNRWRRVWSARRLTRCARAFRRATTQTAVAQTGNPPVDWDTTTGRNIVWSVELGNKTFGRPVVAGDAVYVGTDNARQLNPAFQEESGVLMAFRVTDGRFLWQDLAPRVERGLREFLLPSTTSAPYVEGNRLYYVTAECQLRSLDTKGFRDGEKWSVSGRGLQGRRCGRHRLGAGYVRSPGCLPHEASNSEVLPVGDLLMVSTSNGQNEGDTRVPSPRAPSLIAVNKHSGEVVWRAIGPGEQVLHGQWSSARGGRRRRARPGALPRLPSPPSPLSPLPPPPPKSTWMRPSTLAATGLDHWPCSTCSPGPNARQTTSPECLFTAIRLGGAAMGRAYGLHSGRWR